MKGGGSHVFFVGCETRAGRDPGGAGLLPHGRSLRAGRVRPRLFHPRGFAADGARGGGPLVCRRPRGGRRDSAVRHGGKGPVYGRGRGAGGSAADPQPVRPCADGCGGASQPGQPGMRPMPGGLCPRGLFILWDHDQPRGRLPSGIQRPVSQSEPGSRHFAAGAGPFL